jgi:hypothetical protein
MTKGASVRPLLHCILKPMVGVRKTTLKTVVGMHDRCCIVLEKR